MNRAAGDQRGRVVAVERERGAGGKEARRKGRVTGRDRIDESV